MRSLFPYTTLFRSHSRGEGFTVEQLHDDEELLALFAQLVDLADVGVTDAGGRAGFADEAVPQGGVAAEAAHPLDGDQAAQSLVPSLVHHPHAALAQLPGQDVMANGFELGSGRGGGLGGPLEPAKHGIKVGGPEASGLGGAGTQGRRGAGALTERAWEIEPIRRRAAYTRMKGPRVGPYVTGLGKEVADACTRLWAQHFAR